ncbi:MAG: hypothetical protein WA417_15185 [Stellaceae bacterium]
MAARECRCRGQPDRGRNRTEDSTSAERDEPPLRTAPRLPPPAKRSLRRQNRLLALVLGSVAVLGFATVLSLAVLLHYAEAHHLLANL